MLKAGIVGLPNVGKSTLFNEKKKKNILAANYPFATIDPNVGVVTVPDYRLEYLENMYILSEQIKGILNIGLERLLTETELNDKLKDSYPIINLQDIYRYGLSFINDVRNKAIKILNTKENPSKDPFDSVNLEILTSLSGKIPYLPLFVKDSENFISDSENKLIRGQSI